MDGNYLIVTNSVCQYQERLMVRIIIDILHKANEVILRTGEIIFIGVVIAVLLVSVEKIYLMNEAVLSGESGKRFIEG